MTWATIKAIIAGVAAMALAGCHGDSALELAMAHPVDGPALTITLVDVGGYPQFVCSAEGFIWGIGGRPRFWRLDERTNAVTGLPIGWLERDEITGFAVGEGSLWISTYPPLGVAQKTVRFDAQTGAEQAVIEAGGAIAVGEGALWAFDHRAGLLRRADVQSHSIQKAIAVRPGPRRVLAAGGSVWLLGIDDGVLTRINPDTNRVESEAIAGEPHHHGFIGMLIGGDTGFYSGLCISDSAAWITDHRDNSKLLDLSQSEGTLARVELSDMKASTPRPVGRWPMSPVEFAGWIWLTAVNESGKHCLVRIDPRNGHVAGVYELKKHKLYRPESSITLIAGETALWAGSDGAMQRIDVSERRRSE
jgi:hypothetical protein